MDSANIIPERSPLSGVVIALERHDISRVGLFRRYGGSFTTSTRVNGLPDVMNKSTHYRVGRRSGAAEIPTDSRESGAAKFSQMFRLNESLFRELDASARKYLSNAPDFSIADLSGVVARLAGGLALYSLQGRLSMTDLRGQGVGIRVRGLTAVDRGLPSSGFVYVPKDATLVNCPEALAAIICAVNGAGGVAVTDMVTINPETNAPRLRAAEDADLAYGCLVGLRMLLSMYESSESGAIAGWAVAKGIHNVLTVVSHSDEGGYIRDVLRCGEFAAPTGGVYVSQLQDYTHFPVFVKGDRLGVNTLVDSIALKSAAAAAVCDPCVKLGDKVLPTTFSRGMAGPAGVEVVDTAAAGNRVLRGMIARGSGIFSQNYVREMGRIICGNSGGVDVASKMMVDCFSLAAASNSENRHIVGNVVAPFYWIEPTTLYSRKTDTRANSEGLGVIVGTEEICEAPAFGECKVLFDCSDVTAISFKMRNLRTSPGILHSYMHREGSLHNYVPYRMVPERIALMGGGHDTAHPAEVSAGANLAAQRGLDAYSWRHGSCDIPSPAECMYIGGEFGMLLKKADRDFDAFAVTPRHVVVPKDGLGSVTVTMAASKPVSFGLGGTVDVPSAVRRSRGRAEYALSALNNNLTGGVSVRPTDIVPMAEEPGAFDDNSSEARYGVLDEIRGVVTTTRLVEKHVQGAPMSRVYVDQPLRAPGAARARPGGGPLPGTRYTESAIGEGSDPAPPTEEGEVKWEEGEPLPPGETLTPAPLRDEGAGLSE